MVIEVYSARHNRMVILADIWIKQFRITLLFLTLLSWLFLTSTP